MKPEDHETLEKFIRELDFRVEELDNKAKSLRMDDKMKQLRDEAVGILKGKVKEAQKELDKPNGNPKSVIRVKRLLRERRGE